ncbi:hypothetical protein A3K86_17830 [Photobacterium jeanii]|uniref:HTH lysR-type domain-containing protein n=1 Tax=Photobacterium jeanii TaxID=858640 RepID=A0A178K289_9GAMM|nr:LysR family transcriptional regulator [Photobacterium jeanii]OAN10853.1 hypothetical protein A3K86_17830 [Photobacterium jeanii]PST90368.1 LysR family transcriptional regulator [Photobacterium jeanii]
MKSKAQFSLEQLAAFVTTSDEGSFKQAAIKLGKHATTVSQQVATLEIDLGFQLFERKVRKIHLTQQGQEFYRYAKPVLVESMHLSSKLAAMEMHQPDSFTLALDVTVRDRQLLRCVKAMTAQFPTLAISVLSGDPLQVAQWVREGQADVGIITTLFQNLPQLTVKQLFNFELVYVASPKWLADKDKVSEQDIRQFPQIIYQFVEQTPQLSGHILANRHFTAKNLADLMDLVALNMGWAIVPRYRVEEYLESGELALFTVDGAANVNWFTELLLPADTVANSAVAAFIEQVKTLSDR